MHPERPVRLILRMLTTSNPTLDVALPQRHIWMSKPTSHHVLMPSRNIPSLVPLLWRYWSLSPGVLIRSNSNPLLPATIWGWASHADNVTSSVLASDLLLIVASHIIIMASIDDTCLDIICKGRLTLRWHPDLKRTASEVCMSKPKAILKVHVHTLNYIEVRLLTVFGKSGHYDDSLIMWVLNYGCHCAGSDIILTLFWQLMISYITAPIVLH